MGFHIRKTFKTGLFNFNLSNSGIGTSFGIKGLRVGVDGKGRTYIGGGKGILRYRKYLSGKNIEENQTIYSMVSEYLPYMLKENTLVLLNKILFWIIAPLLCLGAIGNILKDPFMSLIIFCIVYLFSLPPYLSRQAKARKECNKAMRELENGEQTKAIEYFKNALIYKNTYYQERLNKIIEILSQY